MGNRIRVGMCTCSWGHEEGQGGLSPTSTEASSPGWRGARECDMCCGDRTATCLRRTCIRIATVCSSAALLSIPHLFTNPPLPPLSPFPFACMRSAIPTACLLMFCQWTGFASAHRRLPLRANPRARQCPPVSIDARLSQRSLRAPSGAATQQIGPPMRAIAGACTVTMATVRPNPPGRQRTFSCQKRRTLRGSDGFAPTTPIRSSTAAAPCSFALSLKPTGGHAE